MHTVCSQNFFETYQKLVATENLVQNEQQIDSVFSACLANSNFMESIKIAHDYSIKFYRKRQYSKAIKYGLLEIEVYEDQKIVNNSYAGALYNMGKAHYNIGELEKGLIFYNKNVELQMGKEDLAYCQMGQIYHELGDSYKGIDFYLKGIQLLKEAGNYRILIKRYLDLAVVYEQVNTPKSLEKKLVLLQKVESLSKKHKLSKRDYYSLYNSFASYYNNISTFDFKKSSDYYKKHIDKAISLNDSSVVCGLYANVGSLHNTIVSDSAIFYLEKGLPFCKNENNIARVNNLIFDYYAHKEKPEEALSYIERSLAAGIGKQSTYKELPQLIELSSSTDPFVTLWALTKKASVLMKLSEQNKNTALEALSYLQLADSLVTSIQGNVFNEDSKFLWRKEASNVYAKAVSCSKLLDRPDLAFYFTEKNKALLLIESILTNAEKMKISDTLIDREAELRRLLLKQRKGIATETNSVKRAQYQNALFDLQHEYEALLAHTKENYPHLKTMDEKTKIFSLKDAQNTLDDETIIISYLWNKRDNRSNVIFGMGITNSSSEIFEVEGVEEVEKLLEDYQNTISRPFESINEQQQYLKIAHTLYLKLFPSKELRSKLFGKKILIIPDGKLQYLSFEALVTSLEDGTYLLEDAELSYGYSWAFLKHNKTLSRTASKQFLALCPKTFNNGLGALPHTQSEVEDIQLIMKGDVLMDGDAQKEIFLNTKQDYSIIHLATHAEGGVNPWIAFKDSKLEMDELYLTRNNAQLIVLSACKTSLGEHAKGEGVLSLARGFFYAGANSVVSSLWNVNDKSTSSIMTHFYSKLKEGETKSSSLRSAKLDYIESSSLSDASPYYWASFILVGDTESINFGTQFMSVSSWILLALLLFTILGFAAYRRKN